MAPAGRLRKAELLIRSHSERNIFFLDAAGTNGLEPFPQAFRVHSRGRANRLEILVVVKQELLGFAAEAQRTANPFL